MTSTTEHAVDLSSTDAQARFQLIAGARRQLFLPPMAYSVDGRSVLIEAPIEGAPQVGSLARAETAAGHLLVHVLAARIELRDGPQVQIAMQGLGGGTTTTQLRMRACAAEGVVVGSVADDDFTPLRAADAVPFPETLLLPATDADVRAYHAWVARTGKGATLELGSDPMDTAVRGTPTASAATRRAAVGPAADRGLRRCRACRCEPSGRAAVGHHQPADA